MTPTDTYLGLRAFCDELARCGVTDACTSPGSRSTPLVLSLAREPGLHASSHVDERAGAFFALGLAKASGRPAVLACTSGTAAANYAPAVIEAWEARVPLLVLTADRPPELRDLGAGQTIDQVKLYGRAAKWFLEVDDAPATPGRVRWLRQLACRAVATATGGRPGPVHLNFTLREPLMLDAPLPADEPGGGGRLGGRPWIRTHATPPRLAGPRPVAVAGRLERPGDGAAVAVWAAEHGVPLLADPLSGGRRGPAAIAHYDAVLRDGAWAAAHRPTAVLRVGDLPTSKPLRQWLATLDDVPQMALDPEDGWQDPTASVTDRVTSGELPALVEAADPAWRAAWLTGDAALPAVRPVWAGELSEPLVAERTHAALERDDTLVVAASMPVRDLETFAAARDDPPRVLSNRGANGIDGTVSTAFGVAAASPGHTVLLCGDVALLHDLSGLAAARRLGLDLTVVVIHNDGGGIFDFLPVSAEGADFERHVSTAHGADLVHAVALAGGVHARATTPAGFDDALRNALTTPGLAVVEVRTDRGANVALHRRTWAAVAERLRADVV